MWLKLLPCGTPQSILSPPVGLNLWLEWHLTHWGWVTHICVGKLSIIDSDNGLSPGRRQAIIWTNAGILLIRLLGTNFNEIVINIQIFSFKKMHLKMSSAKWRPFCLGLNVLTHQALKTWPILCRHFSYFSWMKMQATTQYLNQWWF